MFTKRNGDLLTMATDFRWAHVFISRYP